MKLSEWEPSGVVIRSRDQLLGMAHESPDHDHADSEAEPITERMHETSRSANLEKPRYETGQSLLADHAVEAIKHTASGQHVNLVTHKAHGHPEVYLYDVLATRFTEGDIEWEYIEQCGCGGHAVRVHVQ